MAQPRIDLRKLARTFLVVLVLPSVLALALDQSLGTWPILTIVAVAIVVPVATIVINRIALQEMDRIILEVAPPEAEPDSTNNSECDDNRREDSVTDDRAIEPSSQTS